MSMKNLKVISILAAIVAASTVVAVEVTPEQAQTAARNWVRRSPVQMTASFASGEVLQAQTSKADDGTALYHVVEMDGGGFVVTSGDTELPPVIAFSASGTLDLSDVHNPLVALLEQDLSARKSQLAKPKVTRLSASQPPATGTPGDGTSFEDEWAELLEEPKARTSGGVTRLGASYSSVSDVRVEPMVQSKWTQARWNGANTFNYYTPNNYVCGCVATAFAQIMRYWQKPTASVSAGTYTCWVDGKKVSKTMKGGTYNWGSMPLTEADCTTDTKRQAIGKLTYDVGVAAQMGWTSGESGTLGCVAAQALRNRFGYASAHSYCNGASGMLSGNLASNADFRNAILASLDASMPVVIGIVGSAVGHEVVVDGYGYNGGSLIYCHINCGWSGSQDAWYNLIGEGVTSYSFSRLQDVAYNIHPTVSGDVISGRVLNASGSPVSGATVTLTTSSGSQRTATTNAKGIYWFRAAANASYTVAASHGGLSSPSQTVSLPSSYDTEWTITDMNADGTVSINNTTPSLYPNGKLGNKWGVDLTLGSSSPQPSISLATALDNTTLTFTTGGSASWYGQAENSSDGVDAARSGAIGNSQQTWLQTTVTGPGVLSFYWNVSCEGSVYNQNWDYLNVSIDDEEKARICGTDNKWTRQTYSIPSGTHTVRWQYSKDSSASKGDDAGYVDQIVWTPTTSPGDAYDPGDDTPGGGTALSPTDSLATHGGHTLSATDNYDFFKVTLSAGYKYVFEAMGSMDTYGDLFDSTSLANSVACDDDGGSGLNFKIEYAPESSGTYYLRVRAYTLGTAGSYALTYRREAVDNGGSTAKPDLQPYTPSGWTSPLVVSASNISKEGATTFTRDDSLYVSWAAICRNADASGIFYSRLYVDERLVQSWRTTDLQKNYYAWVGGYLVGKLEPGTHTLKIVHDETGAVAESDESNNVFESTITVTADGFPNLKVSNVSVSVSTISLSDPLTVHWRVQNDGQAAAAKSKTRFRIYKNASGSAQPQLMKTIWLDCAPLAAGAGRNYKQSVSLKSFGTGTYSFVIGADGKSTVAESNETDNDDTAVAYVVKDIATRSTARVDWQYHKRNSSEPAAFYLSTSEKSKKKVSTFKRGQKIYVQLNFWNAKKNVRTLDGVYARIQINGGGSRTWYWPPMGSSTTGYISNGNRAPSFLQNLPAGTYTLTATLDCYDNWWESNEKNNVKRLSFTVVDTPTIYGNATYTCALRESVCWPVTSAGTMTVKGLPPGLTYSGGAIVGKPTKVGTYTAKFTAKNAAGTKTKSIRIIVTNPGFTVNVNVRANGATGAMDVTSGASVPMYAGVVQSITVASTPGKDGIAKSAASSVTATGLPPGLKYAKGKISGTPSKTGTYTVKLVFKNALGWSKSFTMKMVVSALPAFARGTFNGWTFTEGGAKRKVTVSVTSAGKISAKIGSLAFSRTGWTVGEDGSYVAKMLTTRTTGTGKSAKKYSDVLVLTLDPAATWTEDQLMGSVATFSGTQTLSAALAAWEAGTLVPQNADVDLAARRNPFYDKDNVEAKAVAEELAAQGTMKFTDASELVWNVKVAPTGVATISRVTGTGKNKRTVSASSVVNVWTNGVEYSASARFLVDGQIVEIVW